MDGDVTLESTGLAGTSFLWSVAGGPSVLTELPPRVAALS
jgi:hypothetical protein